MQQIGVILVIFVLLWTPSASFSLKDVRRSWLRQTVSSFNSPTRIAMDLTVREIDPTIKYMPSFNLNDEDDKGEEEEGDDDEGEAQEDGEAGSPLISASEPAGLGLVKGVKFPTTLNGSDVRVGIIMTRWNSDIIQGLYKGVNESLTACGVKPEHVFSTYVPGAFELPVTAKFLAMSKRFDVILCLGCLIKGETMHFEYIAQTTSQGIMQVGLDSLVPCVFGVLTVLNEEQARKRSSGEGNEGVSWGKTAVEMGLNRISALGMDKPKKQKTPSSQFVTFNGDVTSKGKEDAEKSSKTQRKIGF